MSRDLPHAGAVSVLEEPLLEFRYRQRLPDPRDGLSIFGPCDSDEPSHPKSMTYAAIGPSEGVAAFEEWSRAMQRPASFLGGKPRLWPTFPGFEAAFAAEWVATPVWKHVLDRPTVVDASREQDPWKRTFGVVNLYLNALEPLKKVDDKIDVVFCIVPDAVFQNCRPESKIVDALGARVSKKTLDARREGQTELFDAFDPEQYKLSQDFRRQIKARAMVHPFPIQIIRESTLRLNDENKFGDRQLSPLSHRMWNLATSSFYKGGGKPWRLATARDGVSYLGIAFRRADGAWANQTACCAAQMFLNSGDGIVFLGEYGPWYSPEERQFRLKREAARDLVKGALATYEQLHGKPLTEVFLHARSDISDEEFAGYVAGCPSGVKVVGVRVRAASRATPRLYRIGDMPVLRGTLWKRSERSGYLFASGFKERLGTYDGWETPAPLQIDIQHGEADLESVARDILGLTKLNYNSCSLGDAKPVTIEYSDAVGEILVSNPTVNQRRPQFRFYI